MRFSFSGQHRRRPLPTSLVATLFALACCSLQASCDSERARGGASRSAPAVSTLQPGGTGSSPASAVQPKPRPSPSAIVPKEQYTIEERRCNPNDADCLPEPYNGSEDMIVGTVTGAPYKYRASRQRYPMREGRESEGTCEHDGDCLARSMCVECVSRFRVPPSRQCPAIYLGGFDGAFCGCVEKRCRWFTQRLTQRVVSSTKDLEMRIGGALVTDTNLLRHAAELFERDLANCYDSLKSLLPARHRFVVASVGKYGVTETTVSGSHPSVRKCAFDAIAVDAAPSWISDDLLARGEIRFSGVIEAKMAWVP
jgi:hypothetical protein